MYPFNTFVLMPFGANGEYSGGQVESEYIYNEIIKPGVIDEARVRITEAIREGLSESVTSDSYVFDVLPAMSVSIPGVAKSFGAEAVSKLNVMSWEEYMDRIEVICGYLDNALREYKFIPAAVIGITNGGLIAADLIGKRVYAGRDTPVLSLWAKRHEVGGESAGAYWYFDNEYNDSTMKALKNVASKKNGRG